MRNIFIIVLIILFFYSCREEETIVTEELKSITTIIDSRGYDFSLSAVNPDSTLNDVFTCNYNPNASIYGHNPAYTPDSIYTWLNNSNSDSINLIALQYYSDSTSPGELTSYSWEWNTLLTPLIDNHYYIIQCLDGVASIRIISTSPELSDTTIRHPVQIEYTFLENKQ